MSRAESGNSGFTDDFRPAPKRRRPLRIREWTSIKHRSNQPAAMGSYGHTAMAVGAYGNVSPPPSHTSSDQESLHSGVSARFMEWPLPNASLKRVTGDGPATLQLQFTWYPYTQFGYRHRSPEKSSRTSMSKRQVATTSVVYQGRLAKARWKTLNGRTLFPEEEDRYLVQLKGRSGLSWKETHKQFKVVPWA